MYFKVTTVNGQYFWQIYTNAGTTIAQAPNIYSSLAAAQTDINNIKTWASSAAVNLPATHESPHELPA